MDSQNFHHALKIVSDVCIGCSHCMRVCPTEAIRVRGGKASLNDNRCIDCGECYRVCPVNAIIIEQDDFLKIFNYQHRIALVPAVLLGQFPDDFSPADVRNALVDLGFTDVVEVESTAPALGELINEYIADKKYPKPVISSFCPAVVRLIQVKFPALVDNIMLLKPPLDITAILHKKMLVDKGVDENQIGIFYITPCAAKIAAIKSPVGEDFSEITGVINMDVIYNKVLKSLKARPLTRSKVPLSTNIDSKSILWALTNGEASHVKGRCLSIDSLNNVIEFLEKIENDEIDDVDFLEIRACDEGCAGGVLTSGNRFLTVERLRKRSEDLKEKSSQLKPIYNGYEIFLKSRSSIQPIKPRSMMKLDEDMARAMKKMERVHRYMCFLPGIDCGACGAPSCQALAEDIVKGEAAMSHCIFLQKNMEQTRKLHSDHSFRIMEKIWGKDRFEKNCNKVKGVKDKG